MDFVELTKSGLASDRLYLAREIFLTSFTLWTRNFPLENPHDYCWFSRYDVNGSYCYPRYRTPEEIKAICTSVFPEDSESYKSSYEKALAMSTTNIIISLCTIKDSPDLSDTAHMILPSKSL